MNSSQDGMVQWQHHASTHSLAMSPTVANRTVRGPQVLSRDIKDVQVCQS